MEERHAIARLKQGDPSGLEELVKRYQAQAVRTAYLIVRDLPAAEDITQAAFIRAFDRIEQFDSARPFGPWFLRGIVNDAIKAAVRRERSLSLEAEHDNSEMTLADTLPDPAPGPAELLEAAESSEQVWMALGLLTPEQRAVVVLRYYLDLSEAEMTGHLDAPPGTIKWRLHAARKRLRNLLRPLWRPYASQPDKID